MNQTYDGLLDHPDLPNMEITKIEKNETGFNIYTVRHTSLIQCPDCGSSENKKCGKKQKGFMDLPFQRYQVRILIEQQRYQCKGCYLTFREQYDDVMDEKRLMTKRLVQYIETKSFNRTFVSLSQEIGVDNKTIRIIFGEYVERLEKQLRKSIPTWIGIQELFILNKPRTAITNIGENTLIDLVENRTKDILIHYLSSLENKDHIQYVTMDIWNPYREAVSELLPQAKLTVDPVQLKKLAHTSLEMVRKKVREGLSTKEKRSLIQDKVILLKRQHELTSKESALLGKWGNQFPLLTYAYTLKDGLDQVLESQTKEEFLIRLNEWKKGITIEVKEFFQPLLDALNGWEKEILAYYDHPACPSYIKFLQKLQVQMNRVERGYSFYALRANILFTDGQQNQ